MAEKTLKIVGEVLFTHRKKAQKLSLKSLSEKAGITTSYLFEIEKGKANLSMGKLIDIVHALGLGVDEFFTDFTQLFREKAEEEKKEASIRYEKKKSLSQLWQKAAHDSDLRRLLKEVLSSENHLEYIEKNFEGGEKSVGDHASDEQEGTSNYYHPKPEMS